MCSYEVRHYVMVAITLFDVRSSFYSGRRGHVCDFDTINVGHNDLCVTRLVAKHIIVLLFTAYKQHVRIAVIVIFFSAFSSCNFLILLKRKQLLKCYSNKYVTDVTCVEHSASYHCDLALYQ